MTIIAEHIIGLSALETGRYHYGNDAGAKATIAQAMKKKFAAIRRQGRLEPRGETPRTLHDSGNQFGLDTLAGDGCYVFLSAGPRYREARDPEICHGFVFDAEKLIEAGALVGPDLLHDYEALADQIIEEVEQTLPTPPPLSGEELAEFARMMEITDPDMLEFVRTDSTRRYHDIAAGLESGDESVPGVREALARWQERVPALQAKKRKSGAKALELLQNEGEDGRLEILVDGPLDLRQAVATIEAGRVIYLCRRCRRPLRNRLSIAAGYGPRCRKETT